MILIIPQWQGAGKKYAITESIKKIKEKYFSDIEDEIKIELDPSGTKENINHYDSILKNIKTIKNFVAGKDPDKIFLLGGECSCDLIPVLFLNKKYQNNLSVLWLDAHGDLNTNITSKSMNFHGMILRMLFGEGEEKIKTELPCFLKYDQIIMAGARDLEDPEKEYIDEKALNVIKVQDLKTDPYTIVNELDKKNLYIHIDLDILDPGDFQYTVCHSKNGITFNELINIINTLINTHNIVGMSIVEYNDKNNRGIHKLGGLINIMRRVGKMDNLNFK